MSPEEAGAWVERVCLSKTPMGRNAARVVAARKAEATGLPYRAYRCPFPAGQRHWHVGRVLSVETMALIAEAMRTLAA